MSLRSGSSPQVSSITVAEPRTFPYKFSSTFFFSNLSLSGKSVSTTCAPKRAAMHLIIKEKTLYIRTTKVEYKMHNRSYMMNDIKLGSRCLTFFVSTLRNLITINVNK